MNLLLETLREGLSVEISDAALLSIYEEAATTCAANMANGQREEPLSKEMVTRKAIEKTKRIVKLRGQVAEKLQEAAAPTGAMARIKNRVRQGGRKVQRRKKVSARKGWTWNMKKKRAVRIDALDRMKMARNARRSAPKRRSQRSIMKVKRARSMRMRKALGFDKK